MKEYDSDLPEPDSAQTEAAAVRYGFDGYGWKYADEGNGSDWYRRALEYDDAEPLYAHHAAPAPGIAEAIAALREIVSQIDQGGSGGKVFARDACIARARLALRALEDDEVVSQGCDTDNLK